jgi:chemosensory pili system protein ChpA (sensor histidine kinase/response regulator)
MTGQDNTPQQAALGWVKDGLDQTLQAARAALDTYVESPDDSTPLTTVAESVKVAQGTLEMLEYFGAAMLAEEVAALAQYLGDGTADNAEQALEVLTGGMLQLPDYIDRLQTGHRDLPLLLLPALNDMRAARHANLLSENLVFLPDLSLHESVKGEQPVLRSIEGTAVSEVAKKLRSVYQFGFVGLYKQQGVEAALDRLQKVAARLELSSRHERVARFWWIIGAVVESLRFGALEPSVAVKLLIAKADREIKRLIDDGEEKVSESQPLDLIRNLLYYLASADDAGEKSKAVKEAYRLSEFLPRDTDGSGGIAGLNASVLSSVSESVKADIDEIKSLIEVYVNGDPAQTDKLAPAAEKLRTVADTLAMLGLGSMRQMVLEQFEVVQGILDGKEEPSQERLLEIAGKMLRVESSVDDYAHGRSGKDGDAEDQEPSGLGAVRATVVNEALHDLRKVKEAITDYILDSSQREQLASTPQIIEEMRGALLVANLERVIPLTDELHRYLTGKLLQAAELPDSHQLETLGEAVASIEYYLEAVRDNRVDADAILEAAEQGLDFLARSVSATADRAEPVGGEGLQVETLATDASVEAPGVDSAIEPVAPDLPGADPDTGVEAQTEIGTDSATGPAAVEQRSPARSASHAASVASATDDAVPDLEQFPVMEGEPDEELLEIFLEEATEEVGTIQDLLPGWREDPADEEALATIRRAFHTLKGSGRMVGAKRVGEFAWEHENLLNRVIDGTVPVSDAIFDLLGTSMPVLSGLIDQLKSGQDPDGDVAALMVAAHSLAQPAIEQTALSGEEPLSPEVQAVREDMLREQGQAEQPSGEAEIPSIDVVEVSTAESPDAGSESESPTFGEPENASIDLDDIPELIELSGTSESDGGLEAGSDAVPDDLAPDSMEEDAIELASLEDTSHIADTNDGLDIDAPGAGSISEPQVGADFELGPAADDEDMAASEAVEDVVESLSSEDLGPHDQIASEVEQGADDSPDVVEDPVVPFGQATPQAGGASAPGASPPTHTPTSSGDAAGVPDGEAGVEFDTTLLEIFKQEVDDHLSVLDAALEGVPNGGALSPDEGLYRALHTVKGAGRTGGFTAIADLAAELEAIVRQYHELGVSLEGELTELVREGTQALHEMTHGLSATGRMPAAADELIGRAQVIAQQPPAQAAAAPTPAPEVPPAETVQVPDDELVQIFLEEAQELLDQIETALQGWGENFADKEPVKALQRQLHTVKGGARMAGLGPIGDLSHALESLFIAVVQDRIAADKSLHNQLNTAFDRLYAMITSAVDKGSVESDPFLVLQLEAARKGQTLEAAAPVAAGGQEPEAAGEAELAPENPSVPPVPESLPEVQTVKVPDDDLVPIFLEEAQELVDQIETTLQAWGEDLGDKEPVKALQRQLHTVKGGARMAGLTPIGDLSHSLESLFIAVVEDRTQASKQLHHLLNTAFDRLSSMVTSAAERGIVQSDPALVAQVDAARSGTPMEGAPPASAAPPEPALSTASPAATLEAPEPLPARKEPESSPAESTTMDRRTAPRAAQETVRVRAGLLDNLVNVAGEVSIYRSRIEQQIGALGSNLGEFGQTIGRLRQQLRSLELETEAQVLSSHRQMMEQPDAAFDPLEMDRYSRMQELSRALAESVNDLVSIQTLFSDSVRDSETLLLQQSRLSTDLQDGLMRTRMVQVGTIMPRLRRIVRQTCDELGKDATLSLDGGEHEIDSKIIDRMVAPLEHLLRNAVAHGIEPPDERRAHGKPETGSINMQVTREGSEVVLRVSDDGRGIDVNKIRAKAIKLGLMEESQGFSEHEIMQFILESGFSTADQVNQIAGRGVGMDVVHAEIKQLGGALQIDSILGKGTTFSARLPFTLAINQAVLVQVHEETYALPVVSIDGIARLSTEELQELYSQDDPTYGYGESVYELHYLGEMLGLGPPLLEGEPRWPVLMLRAGDKLVALQVDIMLGSFEIVVKSVGPQLSQVGGIAGATILGDGQVVLILDVPGLARSGKVVTHLIHEEDSDAADVLAGRKKPTEKLLIMVVDDSITMRKVATRMLTKNDFDVVTAKDGVDALSKLQDITPALMLLDIEMPRMDGYELASHVRNDSRLAETPIVMVTSRTGEKHRTHAMELGVDRYFGKPYQEAEIMETIHELLEDRKKAAS